MDLDKEKPSKSTESAPNPFKNSSGARYTRGLFYETTLEDKSTVVYTLKDRDHKGYRSLKKLYLEEADTTEYTFSQKYLDGYDHWLLLVQSEWFKPFVTEWREELRVKKEQQYIRQLEEIVAQGGKDRTSALKTLLERVRKPREALKRGRPRLDTSFEDKRALDALEREMELDRVRMTKSE